VLTPTEPISALYSAFIFRYETSEYEGQGCRLHVFADVTPNITRSNRRFCSFPPYNYLRTKKHSARTNISLHIYSSSYDYTYKYPTCSFHTYTSSHSYLHTKVQSLHYIHSHIIPRHSSKAQQYSLAEKTKRLLLKPGSC